MQVLVGTLIVLFVLSIAAIELCLYLYRKLSGKQEVDLSEMLKRVSLEEEDEEPVDVLLDPKVFDKDADSGESRFTFPGMRSVDRLLDQANIRMDRGNFLLVMFFLASVGFLAALYLTLSLWVAVVVALAACAVPVLYSKFRKKQRLRKFERQLPEALDLMARALRAGHAFSTGMALAGKNFSDPLGPEFQRTVNLINYGHTVQDALKDLAQRIDCPDLRFFVVSAVLQKETGGNLAEIIEGISRVIRERFAFKDKVMALTAEARISSSVLSGIILFIVALLYLMNPSNYEYLLSDPLGRVMAGIAAVMMATGLIFITRMANRINL